MTGGEARRGKALEVAGLNLVFVRSGGPMTGLNLGYQMEFYECNEISGLQDPPSLLTTHLLLLRPLRLIRAESPLPVTLLT